MSEGKGVNASETEATRKGFEKWKQNETRSLFFSYTIENKWRYNTSFLMEGAEKLTHGQTRKSADIVIKTRFVNSAILRLRVNKSQT